MLGRSRSLNFLLQLQVVVRIGDVNRVNVLYGLKLLLSEVRR